MARLRLIARGKAALLLIVSFALCDNAAMAHDSGTVRSIDALMRAYAGANPGAAVLVVRRGAQPLKLTYGYGDLEARTPIAATTNFRLASVSKQFTAAAVLLLARDGKLDVHDPVRKWFPSLPAQLDGATLHHFLTHTSGIIDYEDEMSPDYVGQVRDADVLSILEPVTRTYFTPGQGYRYSNSAYALLALVVERASGMRYAEFLQSRIFRPLGMLHTVAFEDGLSTVEHRAYGYSLVDGRWQRTDQSPTSAVLGDGGIYSSIEDLEKWDAALYDDRLLDERWRKLAFTAATPTDDPQIRYGYGWRITGDSLWHSGETIGFRNVLVRWPARGMTVVVLTNRNEPEPYELALQIARVAGEESAATSH